MLSGKYRQTVGNLSHITFNKDKKYNYLTLVATLGKDLKD